VTARPSAGNPTPRLTRLVRSKSLLVNKELRNDGVNRIAQRLLETPYAPDFVDDISIARTNDEQSVRCNAAMDSSVAVIQSINGSVTCRYHLEPLWGR